MNPYREPQEPEPEPEVFCETCHGDRVVWDGMGTERCDACNGTGRPAPCSNSACPAIEDRDGT